MKLTLIAKPGYVMMLGGVTDPGISAEGDFCEEMYPEDDIANSIFARIGVRTYDQLRNLALSHALIEIPDVRETEPA